MQKIRRLTAKGVSEFAQYLDLLRNDGGLAPPMDILADPLYSTPSTIGDVSIEPRSFASRREFAEYINRRFQDAGIFVDADEPGMWEWLSLYYFDAVCPISKDGSRKPGVNGRHLLNDPDACRRHRHLLRGPYMLWRRYEGGLNGELDLLLSHSLPVHAIAATHLSERQRLMDSSGALVAASRLYVDPESGKPRRGYSRDANGLRAYCRFLNNLPGCFDLAEMSVDTILALLPDAFSQWQRDAETLQGTTHNSLEILKKAATAEDTSLIARQLNELLCETDTRDVTERLVTIRSNMFRPAVLSAYECRCAISGIGLRHSAGNGAANIFEAEAAHIVPVHRGGKDLVSNGLALNRTIHWAFDHGVIWINNDLRVGLAREADTDPRNHWLCQFRGQRLRTPADEKHHPDPEALRWHAANIAHAV